VRKAGRPPRVVVDTNLVLSALVFGAGTPGALRHAWQQARLQPLVSKPTATELLRALAYPKFKLSSAEQEELLADYLPWCETVAIPEPPPATPPCRGPSDQPFLHLAVAGKADFLVTGDADLLALAGTFSCPITTAARFLGKLEK
jgi:uncharacterized protein